MSRMNRWPYAEDTEPAGFTVKEITIVATVRYDDMPDNADEIKYIRAELRKEGGGILDLKIKMTGDKTARIVARLDPEYI